MSRIAIVLAAGQGRRFGDTKQLACLADGSRLLERTLIGLQAATDDILLVTRAELTASLREAMPSLWPALSVVECPEADLGMGHSLACGVAALPPGCEACLICLGDMPRIRPDTYRQLLDTLASDGILIPEHQGQAGHPVGFGRRFFDALKMVNGDRGARDVIRRYRHACTRLVVDDAGILQDVDTPADLDRINTG